MGGPNILLLDENPQKLGGLGPPGPLSNYTPTSPIHFEVIDSFAAWLILGELLKNVMEIHQIVLETHV